MRTDRLLKLADFLDKLPRKKFDFSIVMNKCGTCGCACGWIPTVFPEECKELGIAYDVEMGRFYRDGEWTTYRSVASQIFEIDIRDADGLFTPNKQVCVDLANIPENATPKRVSKLIREYVKKYDTQ